MSKYLAAAVHEEESSEVLQKRLNTALSLGHLDEAKKVAAKLKQRARIGNRFIKMVVCTCAVSEYLRCMFWGLRRTN